MAAVSSELDGVFKRRSKKIKKMDFIGGKDFFAVLSTSFRNPLAHHSSPKDACLVLHQ